jgi:thioredoxin reductase
MSTNPIKTVAVIGSGPVGLAAAAHLLERGHEPVVLEAGPEVGHAVRQWGHVRLFSPWRYATDPAAVRLLATTGWNAPAPDAYPTGDELVSQYIEPLAKHPALAGKVRVNARVTASARMGFDKAKTAGRENALFEVRYRNGKGDEVLYVDAVIDASGTWFTPAPAGGNGLPAIGEHAGAERIAYGIPDILGQARSRYAGRTVAVLGAGHSAVGSLIDLANLKQQDPSTKAIWLLRGDHPKKSFGGGANDQLAARGELGTTIAELVRSNQIEVEAGFTVSSIEQHHERLRLVASTQSNMRSTDVDELIVATGFRPDLSFLGELRLDLDPALECASALAPLIDPNEHSCGTVRPHGARELSHPDSGFYIAGMKSYGRAPTFLMLTGYEQVRSIAATIDGDLEAANRLELRLPETGVCSVDNTPPATRVTDASTDCCAPTCCE